MRYSEIFESDEDVIAKLKKTISSLQNLIDHPSTDENMREQALRRLPIFKEKLAKAEEEAEAKKAGGFKPMDFKQASGQGMVYNNKGQMQTPIGKATPFTPRQF